MQLLVRQDSALPLLIGKNAANDSQTSNDTSGSSSDVISGKPKEVKVVTQRLWAFRPSF